LPADDSATQPFNHLNFNTHPTRDQLLNKIDYLSIPDETKNRMMIMIDLPDNELDALFNDIGENIVTRNDLIEKKN
jgi:hypothetical protein